MITPLLTVKVAVTPLPLPTNDFNLTPFKLLKSYPEPPETRVIASVAGVIGDATFSTIPVILSSSLSPIPPLLIFLPTATFAAIGVPLNPSFNFLGSVLIGLSDNI